MKTKKEERIAWNNLIWKLELLRRDEHEQVGKKKEEEKIKST